MKKLIIAYPIFYISALFFSTEKSGTKITIQPGLPVFPGKASKSDAQRTQAEMKRPIKASPEV